MKRTVLLLFLIAFGLSFKSFAVMPSDTTVIEFTDKGIKKRITVYTTHSKSFDVPKVLNLENLLKEIGVDSTEREKALILIGKDNSKQDTIFVISREGNKIKILTRDPVFKSSQDTVIVGEEKHIIIEEKKDSYDFEHKSDKPEKPAQKKKFFARSDFGIYLGINNFFNNASQGPSQLYDLRTWPSRYVALSFRKNATLIRGEKMDLALSYGPEIAWYNFMFENSNVVKYENNQVSFVKNTFETKKSKLVMPFLNLPVLLNFGFKQEKFKIGIGGYIGYRIGGYSKVKSESEGRVIEKASFGMNKVTYGLTTEFGRKNGLTLFFRYDLNDLFKENQINGKDLQAFSVGIRL